MKRELIIAPSVLSADFSQISTDIADIKNSGSEWVHLDVMDGRFVPNITFGPKFISDIRKHSDLIFDTHLMIENPENFIEHFADAGSDYITVHSEATVHLHRTLQMIKDTGKKAGVSIVPSTPISLIREILSEVDLVLVMTVNPGFGGQSLITNCLHKVKELVKIRDAEQLNYLISVDGGVNMKTISLVKSAGIDVAVAGSAFFSAANKNSFVKDLKEA